MCIPVVIIYWQLVFLIRYVVPESLLLLPFGRHVLPGMLLLSQKKCNLAVRAKLLDGDIKSRNAQHLEIGERPHGMLR